jgi:hypothetical protein
MYMDEDPPSKPSLPVSASQTVASRVKNIECCSGKRLARYKSAFPWLVVGSSSCYCVVCHDFSVEMRSLKASNLCRHSANLNHLHKAAQALGLPLEPRWMAPTAECFKKALKAVKDGLSALRTGMREKHNRLVWCLDEALCDRNRSFLASCQAAGLTQDAQGERTSTLWSAVKMVGGEEPKIKLSTGSFGLTIHGSGADEIASAIKAAITSFFTPRLDPPRGWRGRPRSAQVSQVAGFLAKVEAFTADAGADVQKSIRIISGHSSVHSAQMICPNLKARLRDGAHASSRR